MKPLLLLLIGSGLAAETPVLPEVDRVVEKAIADHEVAGAVTLVSEGGKLVHLSALGHADLAGDRAMKADDLFWIASMTKPVTGAAVMMMQDAGKLDVDDPVSKHLPEFKALRDADGNPVSVTIADCLTHTCGLAELGGGESARITTLAELTERVAAKPVQFAPRSKWQYCQTGINTAARVVEVASGQSFPEFLEQRLFKPLGMGDTSFYPTAARAERLATSYSRSSEGVLEPAPLFFLHGKPVTSRERYPLANGGLFSTARDYHRFGLMLLNGGELDGTRYLSREAVRRMTSIQSGDLKTGFTPGNGWGLGCCVVREPQGVTGALSPGSFGHGGAYGTQAWIDPVEKRVFVLMVQRANFPNSDGSDLRRDFQDAAAKALE